MFFRRFFFALLFGLLLIIGLSGMRHSSQFDQGYQQGYAAAVRNFTSVSAAETAGAETSTPGQTAPAAPIQQSWGSFSVFGAMFKFFLIFTAFAFFMKMLFFGCRRRRWAHKPGHWSHHHHWGKWGPHEGLRPKETGRPQKGDDDYEKQPEDVEPDIRSY